MIENNQTILFQGDSITDCGRNRDAATTPNDLCGLGDGYVMMAATKLLSTRPADGLRIFNRGISGNRIVDLDARIKNDIIHLKPDVLSILIGVNDTWHGKGSDNGVSLPKYERVYRALLDEVREGSALRLVRREAIVGMVNGTICGLLVGGVVAGIEYLQHPEATMWKLGAVVGISMTIALSVGTVVGSSLPLLVRRFGADPATASTIFLTMVTDSMSFLVFLGLASALSGWIGIGVG